MKNFLLLLAFSVAASANAQQTFIGITAGPAYEWTRSNVSLPEHYLALGEGVFIRRETNNRFSFEAGISHSAYQKDGNVRILLVDGPPSYSYYSQHLSDHDYSLMLATDFRITKPARSRLRQFAGLSISAIVSQHFLTVSEYNSSTGPAVSDDKDVNTISKLWTGIHYTAEYDITKRLTVHTTAAFSVNPFDYFSTFTPYEISAPVSSASLNLGLAYRLR